MKPIKILSPVFNWIMRIALVLYAYAMYFDTLSSFQFNNLGYFVALIFTLFSLLLFIGGFMQQTTITVISALILLLIEIYQLTYSINPGLDKSFAVFLMIAGITGHFLSHGRK